jgi:hypothetical protein
VVSKYTPELHASSKNDVHGHAQLTGSPMGKRVRAYAGVHDNSCSDTSHRRAHLDSFNDRRTDSGHPRFWLICGVIASCAIVVASVIAVPCHKLVVIGAAYSDAAASFELVRDCAH